MGTLGVVTPGPLREELQEHGVGGVNPRTSAGGTAGRLGCGEGTPGPPSEDWGWGAVTGTACPA